MAKIRFFILLLLFNLACAGSSSTGVTKHEKNMAQKWKELYMECLKDNPDNKGACDKFRRSYEAESEKKQRQGSDNNNQSYY